jgi:hypothetical protein
LQPELNLFSQRFAERLFTAYPEWRSLARRDPDGFPEPGSLLLIVESPVTGRALTIRTYGNQVTVDFGPHGWHDHFLAAAPRDEQKAFDDAMGLLVALTRDQRVIVTRTVFRRFRWVRSLPLSSIRPPTFGRSEIISWSGRLDKTLHAQRRRSPS